MADSTTLGDPPPDDSAKKAAPSTFNPMISVGGGGGGVTGVSGGYLPGGMATGSGSAPPPPSASTGGVTLPTVPRVKKPSSYQPENLLLPQTTTRKVLIAFLDDSDEPVWAARVLVESVTIDSGNPSDPSDEPRMHLEVSLRKYFDQL